MIQVVPSISAAHFRCHSVLDYSAYRSSHCSCPNFYLASCHRPLQYAQPKLILLDSK